MRLIRHAMYTGVAAAVSLAQPAMAADSFLDVGSQVPITILINSSPWYAGFEAVVDEYVDQTGNEVSLDTTPYTGMLEKARNAVRGQSSPYDILNIDTVGINEFYKSDVLRPLDAVVPGYQLPTEVLSCGDSNYWNQQKEFRTKDGGTLMAVPPNCNVHVLAYRGDLIQTPPRTYDDLLAQCKDVQKRPSLYGYATRGERGNGIQYDFMPFFLAYGGHIAADPANGDYTVTVNSPEGLAALKMFIDVQRSCAPDNVAALGQGDVIQLMAAGSAAMVQTVIAAWGNYTDPTKSAVVDTVRAAPLPEGPAGRGAAIGNWHFTIPRNINDDRAKAAMAFMQWFLTKDAQTAYAEAGGIPVRSDVLDTLSSDPKYAWMAAYKTTLDAGKLPTAFVEGAAIEQSLGLQLNEALLGSSTPEAALNTTAREIETIFQKSGRKTGRLADLSQ